MGSIESNNDRHRFFHLSVSVRMPVPLLLFFIHLKFVTAIVVLFYD